MLTNEGTPDPRSWICSIVCNRLDIKSLRFGSRGRSGAVQNEVILADIKRLSVWLGCEDHGSPRGGPPRDPPGPHRERPPRAAVCAGES